MTKLVNYILKPLTFIGAINCGLIGLFRFDVISEIFMNPTLIRVIYSAIGIAAVVWLIAIFVNKK